MLARHRRLAAAVSAAVCVGATVLALRPPPPPTVAVVVASVDLPGGHQLTATDLVVRRWPASVRSDGTLARLDAALGRTLASPLRRGEPVTDVRLVGAALVDSLPAGLVAVPVRIADAGVAGLVTVGDHVDVVAATAPDLTGGPSVARAVARDVMVLARPAAPAGGGVLGLAGADPGGGALLVLATVPGAADELAGAAAAAPLSLVLRGR